jgi:hypothetical protein
VNQERPIFLPAGASIAGAWRSFIPYLDTTLTFKPTFTHMEAREAQHVPGSADYPAGGSDCPAHPVRTCHDRFSFYDTVANGKPPRENLAMRVYGHRHPQKIKNLFFYYPFERLPGQLFQYSGGKIESGVIV